MWVVFMDADGACWTVPNPEVRMAPNWSLHRRPGRGPFERPSPATPIAVSPRADPASTAMNGAAMNGPGGVNGAASVAATRDSRLNGHDAGPRYDAAPAD